MTARGTCQRVAHLTRITQVCLAGVAARSHSRKSKAVFKRSAGVWHPRQALAVEVHTCASCCSICSHLCACDLTALCFSAPLFPLLLLLQSPSSSLLPTHSPMSQHAQPSTMQRRGGRGTDAPAGAAPAVRRNKSAEDGEERSRRTSATAASSSTQRQSRTSLLPQSRTQPQQLKERAQYPHLQPSHPQQQQHQQLQAPGYHHAAIPPFVHSSLGPNASPTYEDDSDDNASYRAPSPRNGANAASAAAPSDFVSEHAAARQSRLATLNLHTHMTESLILRAARASASAKGMSEPPPPTFPFGARSFPAKRGSENQILRRSRMHPFPHEIKPQ